MPQTQARSAVSMEETAPITTRNPQWRLWQRLAFRAAFLYLVFYYLETMAGLLIPAFRALGSPIGPRAAYRWPWNQLAAWTGVHIFSLDPTLLITRGSTTSDIAI